MCKLKTKLQTILLKMLSSWKIKVEKKCPVMLGNTNCVLKGPCRV